MCSASGGAALSLAATSTLVGPAGLGGRDGREGWKEGMAGLGGRAGSPPAWAALLSPWGSEDLLTGVPEVVQGTLLPPCAIGRHNPSLQCPRPALNHAHDLKGVCLLEKSIWPFLTSRKSNNLYLTPDSVVWQQQHSLPASPPPTRSTE